MVIDKNVVAGRLREFARRFDSLAELARLLEMKTPQQLQPYLTGKSLPGFELLARLRTLGCDPNWLMSGEAKPPITPAFTEDKLEYDDEQMRLEVEEEVGRVAKIVQLWRSPIRPVLARELRQLLRGWFIKVIRAERDVIGKAKKRKKAIQK
jgi:hypothetical protein